MYMGKSWVRWMVIALLYLFILHSSFFIKGKVEIFIGHKTKSCPKRDFTLILFFIMRQEYWVLALTMFHYIIT
jgi:hypothetical protein